MADFLAGRDAAARGRRRVAPWTPAPRGWRRSSPPSRRRSICCSSRPARTSPPRSTASTCSRPRASGCGTTAGTRATTSRATASSSRPWATCSGPQAAGALAAVAAAALGAVLARRGLGAGPRATAAGLWFAAATATLLVTGRLTFALGVAVGSARWSSRRGSGRAGGQRRPRRSAWPRRWPARWRRSSSPWPRSRGRWRSASRAPRGRRRARWPGVARARRRLPGGRRSSLSPASAFWPALAATAAVGIAAGREHRVVRTACAALRARPRGELRPRHPDGRQRHAPGLARGRARAGRRGVGRARPPVAHGRPRSARRSPWPTGSGSRRCATGPGPPATRPSRPPSTRRCSSAWRPSGRAAARSASRCPFTENHWEARWIPLRVPLARGWQRQLDVERNPLFYDGRLTPGRLRRWLRATRPWPSSPSRGWTSTAPGARRRALVTAGRVPGLRLVWRSADWRLYVVDARAPARRARAGRRGGHRAGARRDPAAGPPRRATCASRCASRPTGAWPEAAAASRARADDRTLLRLRAGGRRAPRHDLRARPDPRARPALQLTMAPRYGCPNCSCSAADGRIVTLSCRCASAPCRRSSCPTARSTPLRQVLLFAVAYYAYRYTRGFVDDPQSATVAFENARAHHPHRADPRALRRAQRPGLEHVGARSLQDFASWMYINAQSTVTLAALVYLYLFHNASFYFVRNMFVVAWIIAHRRLRRSARPRRRGSCRSGASSTRSPTSPASPRTASRSTRCSTPTRRCRRCTSASR